MFVVVSIIISVFSYYFCCHTTEISPLIQLIVGLLPLRGQNISDFEPQICTNVHHNKKKLRCRRYSARCAKPPFRVTQGHPLLCKSTPDI